MLPNTVITCASPPENMVSKYLLSEAQMQLCRRAAALALECERMEGDLADGKDVDLDLLNRLCGGLGRLYERVGIKRVASDRTPSIADLMARHQP